MRLPITQIKPAIALLAALAVASAAAQNSTPLAQRSMDEVMAAVAQRYHKPLTGSPSRNGPRAERPTFVFTGKATRYLDQPYKSGAFRVIDEKQLISEQRAVFMLVSQIGLDGDDLMMDYDIPNTASYGTLRLTLNEENIKVTAEDSYRSSSGSRATYARLYGGVACRDNTEMAWRYNFYAQDRESGRCHQPHFPSSESPPQ